jgi:hypothetical protein
MTYKEGKKERPQKDKKESKIENYYGHCCNTCNTFLSHLERKGQIGPCGLTRIVDFKVLGYYSKNYLFQNP